MIWWHPCQIWHSCSRMIALWENIFPNNRRHDLLNMRSFVLTLLLFALCHAGTQVKDTETPLDEGVSLSSNADYLVGPSNRGYHLTVYDIKSKTSNSIFNRGYYNTFAMTALSRDNRWLVAGTKQEFYVFYTSGSPKDFTLVRDRHHHFIFRHDFSKPCFFSNKYIPS